MENRFLNLINFCVCVKSFSQSCNLPWECALRCLGLKPRGSDLIGLYVYPKGAGFLFLR